MIIIRNERDARDGMSHPLTIQTRSYVPTVQVVLLLLLLLMSCTMVGWLDVDIQPRRITEGRKKRNSGADLGLLGIRDGNE